MLLHKLLLQYIPNLNEAFIGISTDTRENQKNKIFLALSGENFDGHDYIIFALDNGALAAITHKSLDDFPNQYRDKIFCVKNTLDFYQQIAKEYRLALNPISIGITGSSGKTTTKELSSLVTSQQYKVHASQGNFNNEIGVPKTILSMPEDTEILIVEMGMRGLGQIALLTKIALPNIAIITNIGTAHIELLGSKEKIKQAKLEIVQGLNSRNQLQASLIVDNSLYQELKNHSPNYQTIAFDSQPYIQLNCLQSKGLNFDINAVVECAKLLKIPENLIRQGLSEYQPIKGRGNFVHLVNSSAFFIDESYNASPDAVYNSIDALMKAFDKKDKIAIIGEIAEVLPELVDKVFDDLSKIPNLTLIDARVKNIEDLVKQIKSRIQENSVILVKASRNASLERIFHHFNIE